MTKDDADRAATVLMVHFRDWFEAHRYGKPVPEPGDVRIDSAERVADAFGWLADDLGVTTPGQRMAIVAFMTVMAEMLSQQGAEIEGTLHTILHPNDPAGRKAVLLRLKTPVSPADKG